VSFTSRGGGALPPSRIGPRVGTSPSPCSTNVTCPAVFRLEDGNFAVIGTHRTEELIGQLPADAGVAPYESIVVIPKEVMLAAAKALMWTLLLGAVGWSGWKALRPRRTTAR
jgi:hypothetical protein